MTKPSSAGEESFALHCRAEKLEPLREFKFHPTRKWKFDFAFPEQKIAVEVEGGIWRSGRHTRPGGFEADTEKYNTAVKMGWRVLRYSTAQVLYGTAINDVLEMFRRIQ